MIDEYTTWGTKIKVGAVHYSAYYDMLEFINFRMETASSCLLLIENKNIADSLGLSRSLLEHYMLFMLMCRGYKYFRIQDLSASLTESQFRVRLKEEEDKLRELQSKSETECLEVRRVPRTSRRLMYVFEGLKNRGDPHFMIPAHYFEFQRFNPEKLRLKDEDYFQYYEHGPKTAAAIKGHRNDAALSYKFYLSYDGLLECLELNELVDVAAIARIEAHYTFLGKFLHPTHNAVRALRDRSNLFGNHTGVGIGQPYTKVAALLAALYLCYLVAGFLDEAMGMIERAPQEYISQAGTGELRALTDSVSETFPYFWFLFNEPPMWDCFNYCVHHATDEELKEWGGYAGVPKDRVPFDQYIYTHLEHAMSGASNIRCGEYRSPLSH